ncbi:MAG: hypothetical protein K2K89_04300 [Ruminococcus sp.]|nr:hypothetical protein [Ruminococcus sp.]
MKKTTSGDALHALNVLICFFLFFGIIYFGTASGITFRLFFVGFWVNFVLALIYKFYQKNGSFKKTVIILRVIAVTVLLMGILAPFTLMKFRHTKLIYPVKRFCYGYGVYSERFNKDILPESLPKKCDDYMFITQGSFPAQDYHPSAYLAFHTDSETLKKYEEHFNSVYDAERHTAHMPDKEKYVAYDDLWLKCPEELPQHVFQRLGSEHIHDFEKAIIYTHYGKGCMLDYNSGLAVFWY